MLTTLINKWNFSVHGPIPTNKQQRAHKLTHIQTNTLTLKHIFQVIIWNYLNTSLGMIGCAPRLLLKKNSLHNLRESLAGLSRYQYDTREGLDCITFLGPFAGLSRSLCYNDEELLDSTLGPSSRAYPDIFIASWGRSIRTSLLHRLIYYYPEVLFMWTHTHRQINTYKENTYKHIHTNKQ